MRSGGNTDPVAVGNRAAEAWAEADARAVVIAATSADGQAALGGAEDAFTDKGKADKARAVAEVAMLAVVVDKMRALAGRVAQQSSTLAEEIRRGLELEGLSIPAVVEMLQTTPAGGGWTALAVLHALLPRGANTRRDPILPRITIAAPDLARERGELIVAPEGRAGLRTALMPLFPDALHDDVHVPLIDLADVATGERAVSTGRGAAHELRLLFEGVTGIGEAARAGYGELIAWTVGELLEAFYRGGGKVRRSGERPGDWELIRRACRWISGAAIPWRVPSGNVQPWAIMTLRSLPGERPALSDPVVFDVRLPPGAGPGPAVDRPALREAGRVSSPAFRIGVAVPSATWIPGRTRRPVRGVGGLWIGDASRYPVFSAHDRRRIAFGPESTHRPGGIDDAWHKSADAAGVVILDTEAVDRDGKRGWIVVPAAAAKAIRKATK